MKQPKCLLPLSFLQMAKFFSHFGVRTLLVLYMVQQLGSGDSHAIGVSALFCGLVEIGGIFGGLVADRVLGLRRAMVLGVVLLAIGYSGLLVEGALAPSLAIAVLGGALFNSNITALLGAAYEEEDSRRKRGFTLFYMMQNLGALLAVPLCGVIAAKFGFRAGFGVAASGMVIGLVLLLNIPPQEGKERVNLIRYLQLFLFAVLCFAGVVAALTYESSVLPFLPVAAIVVGVFFGMRLLRDPKLPKKKVHMLFLYLGALILFFAAEDQICSTLVLLAEHAHYRSLLGWQIPSSLVMVMNPLIILALGAVVAKWKPCFSLALPFGVVALAFATVSFKIVTQSLFGVVGAVVLISVAELMVGPLIFSYASEVAARGSAGTVMGMVPIGFSLAYLSSGFLGKLVTHSVTYESGLGKIALLILAAGFILEIAIRRLNGRAKAITR